MLVGCEFSGTVRDAFADRGHDAWSCDLLDSERPGPHLRMDVRAAVVDHGPWDLLIAHPPCTHLTSARPARLVDPGARHEALELVRWLLAAPVPRVCVENPPGVIGTRVRRATQFAQPWWFGDPYTKATGLWLVGLEPLRPDTWIRPDGLVAWTSVRRSPVERSRTFPGLARAMAEQWG